MYDSVFSSSIFLAHIVLILHFKQFFSQINYSIMLQDIRLFLLLLLSLLLVICHLFFALNTSSVD